MDEKTDTTHLVNSKKSNFLIILLRPPVVSSLYTATSPITPPIALAYLTSSLEAAGYEVYPIDALGEDIDRVTIFRDKEYRIRGISVKEILEKIPSNFKWIGISCMFTQDWPFNKELINEIKKTFPDKPIVVGGEHVTAVPEDILNDCPAIDICVLGEGEETIVDIADYFYGIREKIEDIPGIVYRDKNMNILRTKPRRRIKDIENIPRPNWDKFPIENYLNGGYGHGPYKGRTMPILATRGCPFQCTFCSGPRMWGRYYYVRRPADVVDEMEYYIKKYKAQNFDFYDLTAFVRKDWIIEFCHLLKDRNLNIHYSIPSGTRSEALDEEALGLLYETGCKYIAYAAESGSEDILKSIKKRVNLKRMFHSMKIARRKGMKVRCNLIMGFPHERRRDIFKTLFFQLKLAFAGIDEAPLFGFAPYAGSELFYYLRSTGKIPTLDEAYYKSLLVETDITKATGYTEFIGRKELAFYRFVGNILFFGLSYLLFPWRIFRSIRNIFFRQIMDTTFEQRIFEFLQAYKLIKKKI
jgi:radical SAM superfamily enzyme YgiQ (UPF0313 family)